MHYIGIDLGGTNIAGGLVNEEMEIVLKDSVPTKLPRSAEEIIADMSKLCFSLAKQAGVKMDDIGWIGVGAPGSANRDTGIIEYSNNLNFINVDLQGILEKSTGRKVYIENDANAAAYGEYMAGAAKGCSSAAVITLGTGVGGGFIERGQILNGCNFAAGEIGHMVVHYGGVKCTCGRRGCWEAYSSATGLIRMTKEAMEKDKGSAMWNIAGGSMNNVNGKTAFDAMRAGDKSGSEVVDLYISYLACGLINVINIFEPEKLCIGGGICKEKNYLLKPLGEKIGDNSYSRFSSKQPEICVAKLGNDAGIIGSAMLGRLYAENK